MTRLTAMDGSLATRAAEELAEFIKHTYTDYSEECLVSGCHVGFQNVDDDSEIVLQRRGERCYKPAVVDTAERQRKFVGPGSARFRARRGARPRFDDDPNELGQPAEIELGCLLDECACGDGIGRRPRNDPTRSWGRNGVVGSTLESSGTLRDWDERCTMLGPRICDRCQVPLDDDEDLSICCNCFRGLCWVCSEELFPLCDVLLPQFLPMSMSSRGFESREHRCH